MGAAACPSRDHGAEAALLAAGPRLPPKGVKLYYWPCLGRNVQIHLCLAEVGVEWEDVHWGAERVTDEDARKVFFAKCRELGGNLTTNLPMLEVNGTFYTQSSAILRLVARTARLYPLQAEAAFRVDNIIAAAEDLRAACYMARFGLEKFLAEDLPAHVGNLERMLGKEPFFVQGSFSVADVAVFDSLTTYVEAYAPGTLQGYPRLGAFCGRMAARPRIAEYLGSSQRAVLVPQQSVVPEKVPDDLCAEGCGYGRTWHATHCCDACMKSKGKVHGPKCDRRQMKCAGGCGLLRTFHATHCCEGCLQSGGEKHGGRCTRVKAAESD